MIRWLLSVAGAYLLGSIPFAYLIVRWFTGHDLRQMGSRNPGATNALRVAGIGAGVTVLLCDAGKGAAAVALPRLWKAPPELPAATAVAVTAGHVFPAFMGLRGGKGAATGFGALAVLEPVAALGSLAVFATTVATTRYVSAGSLAGAVALPVLVVGRALQSRRGRPELIIATGAIAALVVGRHRANISRLASRSERRLGDHREVKAVPVVRVRAGRVDGPSGGAGSGDDASPGHRAASEHPGSPEGESDS